MKTYRIQNKYSFLSSLQKSLQTITECVYRIEASILVGTTTAKSLLEKLILEREI